MVNNVVYAVDKLMAETRRIAAEYYRTTQQTLPLSQEIAKYDALRLLNWQEPPQPIAGVDAFDAALQPVLIKSRVIFQENKSSYRIGQLNFEGKWQKLALVLLNKDYETTQIYLANRHEIEAALATPQNPNRLKRGIMSVAKFQALSQCIWIGV